MDTSNLQVNQRHICQTCNKGCAYNRSYLQRHELTHTEKRPHICQTCGKRFTRESSQIMHQLLHTGTRQHSCQTCGQRFIRKSHLYRHRKTHAGERSFICHVCDKRFTCSFSLKCDDFIHCVI